LRLVIIEKLPSLANDPLVRARIEHLSAAANAFRELQLPEAALALNRGGAVDSQRGRLRRGSHLRSRMVGRGYGSGVSAALPPMT